VVQDQIEAKEATGTLNTKRNKKMFKMMLRVSFRMERVLAFEDNLVTGSSQSRPPKRKEEKRNLG
jgi:hypothetical protein